MAITDPPQILKEGQSVSDPVPLLGDKQCDRTKGRKSEPGAANEKDVRKSHKSELLSNEAPQFAKLVGNQHFS